MTSSAGCPACGTVGTHWCLRPPSSATVDVPAARAPHRCPICGGRGRVRGDFYPAACGADFDLVTCRSCDGKGVIWQ